MLATAETFTMMTRQVMALVQEVCAGKLVMVHEGGYSETYTPFCAHAVLEEMTGSSIRADDPFGETFTLRKPSDALHQMHLTYLASIVS